MYGKFRVAKEQIAALIGMGGENVKAVEGQTGTKTVMRHAEGTMYYISPDSVRATAAEAMMSRLVGQDMKVIFLFPEERSCLACSSNNTMCTCLCWDLLGKAPLSLCKPSIYRIYFLLFTNLEQESLLD